MTEQIPGKSRTYTLKILKEDQSSFLKIINGTQLPLHFIQV